MTSSSTQHSNRRTVLECRPVTDVILEVPPIKGFDKMADVIQTLTAEQATGAPVVDELGKCIGILTTTDIQRYRETRNQYESADLTSLDAFFEIDQFGMRRINVEDFDCVSRHMTSPVVVIDAGENGCVAQRLFEHHPRIHHLVVVDDIQQPLGLVTPELVQDAIRRYDLDESRSRS